MTVAIVYFGSHYCSIQPTRHFSNATMGSVSREVDFGNLPLSFEPNRGQTDTEVKFLARGSGCMLFLTNDEAVLTLKKSDEKPQAAVLKMRLDRANRSPEVVGKDEFAGEGESGHELCRC